MGRIGSMQEIIINHKEQAMSLVGFDEFELGIVFVLDEQLNNLIVFLHYL